MNKTYFEMNEAEKQLNLISNNIDYAVCVFSEGLPIYEDEETTRKIIRLQDLIACTLLAASTDIAAILKLIVED